MWCKYRGKVMFPCCTPATSCIRYPPDHLPWNRIQHNYLIIKSSNLTPISHLTILKRFFVTFYVNDLIYCMSWYMMWYLITWLKVVINLFSTCQFERFGCLFIQKKKSYCESLSTYAIIVVANQNISICNFIHLDICQLKIIIYNCLVE